MADSSVSAQRENLTVPNPHRPNVWGMLRDVLVASLHKGQFLVAMVGVMIIYMIFKLDSKDFYQLLLAIIHKFYTFAYLGWVLFFIMVAVALFMFKKVRKVDRSEMERLRELNTDLQRQLLQK